MNREQARMHGKAMQRLAAAEARERQQEARREPGDGCSCDCRAYPAMAGRERWEMSGGYCK